MLKTVKLYGDLADFVGWKEQKAEVKNTREVMRFLLCNHPKLEKYMMNKYYQIDMGEYNATKDDLLNPIDKEIKIIPVVEGKIFGLIGGLLLSGFATELGVAIGLKGLGLTLFAGAATAIGTQMAVNSINNYLTPKPKPMSSLEPEDATVNFAFSGVTNVSRAGVALPLVYGDIFVGSINVSNGIDTDQIEVSV